MADPSEKPEQSGEPQPANEDTAKGPIGWVRTQVPKEELIRRLQAPKDVHVMVSSKRFVMAVCKACKEQIQPADKDGLLWLVCPRCKGVSFIPLANLPRDVHFAEENGGVFEYEVYYVKDLPPQLTPPNTSTA